MKVAAALALLVASLPPVELRAEETALIVHEWGTFTSFQDSGGNTIPGINVDDEPVPEFVHRLAGLPVFTIRSLPARWSQGAPRCHPEVTLRLETPVLYFHPQPGFPDDRSIDVRAEFVGGWLTEYYPSAVAGTPGFPNALNGSTQGSLQWTGLALEPDSRQRLPKTDARVWLAPREVRSAVVVDRSSREAEKYLFYRGVGRIDAPIVIRQEGGKLSIALRDGPNRLERLPPSWIVRVMPDGRVRYRNVEPSGLRTVTAAIPTDEPTAPSQIEKLRRELATAPVLQGLYEDEAHAMLATWQLSYFESEGLRLFFLLPATWTEAQLPLAISPPADTTRVMLGRIELVSPHQRAMIDRLLALPEKAFKLQPLYYYAEYELVRKHLHDGGLSHSQSHSELYRMTGREVPEALQLYESIGRFRDALLAHEWRSATDPVRQARLQRVIELFSACDPML